MPSARALFHLKMAPVRPSLVRHGGPGADHSQLRERLGPMGNNLDLLSSETSTEVVASKGARRRQTRLVAPP